MFPEQVTNDVWLGSILYLLGTIGCLLAIVSLVVIDHGTVRPASRTTAAVQKMVAAMIAIAAFLAIGFGIWNWQYDTAFGVPNALGESIKHWWIGGSYLTVPAVEIDPRVLPSADHSQIFVPFIAAYAGIIIALVHSAAPGRIRGSALYILAAMTGAVVMPIVGYLTWGSVSPLTNRGLHDFVGVFGYVSAGVIALVLHLRLKRHGGDSHREARTMGSEQTAGASDPGLVGIGVGILLVAVALIVPGCGFLFPELGYIGISGTTSGFGLVVVNFFAVVAGGALSGALIGHRTGEARWALLGPLAGYVAGTALVDVATPLAAMAVGFGGTFVALAVDRVLMRAGIQEHKTIPLGLGVGTYGALVVGLVAWGEKTGGFPGLKGEYAFQNATINVGWQLIGLAATVAFVATIAFVTIWLIERTIGLSPSSDIDHDRVDTALGEAQSA